MRRGKKLLIVGGVAGGASCAARARRLSEEAEIILFERGPDVSFANCGLPYFVGKVIQEEGALLVASPALFRDRFNIDVRTGSNVVSIDREKKTIEVEEPGNGRRYREGYDALVLSPGAAPIRPPFPGSDLPGIFTLRNIPDMRRIVDWIEQKNVRRAAVVGAGFIGLEMTENFRRLGIEVTLIEMQDQVMPVIDPEIASFIRDHLVEKGVDLRLGSPVAGFRAAEEGRIDVEIKGGESVETGVVLLALGVRPDVELAARAGLAIGKLGGIAVNARMQTSDPNIWAVGDAVEVKDYVTGLPSLVPLAGPANRQGRLAADMILGKGDGAEIDAQSFRGTQATAVCGVFDLTVASTGASEKQLRRYGSPELEYEKVYLHPNHHAGYYPGAEPIAMKLIFSKPDGKVLGAQAAGRYGVEKRIDVISTAIQLGGTVFDLAEAELCYAPQYGSAKDPVNMAGMIAANILDGLVEPAHWEELANAAPFILDVRDTDEFEEGHLEGAVNIPLGRLRARLEELPRDREIWAHCGIGQRSYYASRILAQHGFKVRNLSGGFRSYLAGGGKR